MDDALLVRMINGLAYGGEQPQTGGEVQALLIAVVGNGRAVDVFHDEVRPALRGNTSLQDARNVRIVHQGERLSLCIETPKHPARVHPQLDELNGDPPSQRLVLLAKIDAAHPTLTELPDDAVRTDRHRVERRPRLLI